MRHLSRVLLSLFAAVNLTVFVWAADGHTCRLVIDTSTRNAELLFNEQSVGADWVAAELPCKKLHIDMRYSDTPNDIRSIAFTPDVMSIKFKPEGTPELETTPESGAETAVAKVPKVVAQPRYPVDPSPVNIPKPVTCTFTAAKASGGQPDVAITQSFSVWLEDFKTQAAACGVSAATLDTAFKDVYLDQKILVTDGKQAEFNSTFSEYLKNRVTPNVIKRGKDMLSKYRTLLEALSVRYGVPANIIVAFWGLESNFGSNTGNKSVINSIATLAYDGRRRNFYQQELFSALQIIDAGDIAPRQMLGSWAGAMGPFQFMPSTFRQYAVDEDGDGRRDIWNSVSDAMASAANYLHSIGWHGQLAGIEVLLPSRFDAYDCAEQPYPNSYWGGLGVKAANGANLSYPTAKGIMLLPSGINGPAFLVYDNFNVIIQWNKSTFYALTVAHLSQRLDGGAPLVIKVANEQALSKEQVKGLQTDLQLLGFDVGKPDGMIGKKTRQSVCQFQTKNGITPDAYPTPSLINAVHNVALSKSQ